MLTQVRWGTLPPSLPRPLDWCQHQPHTVVTVDTCILIEKQLDQSSTGLPLVGWPLAILLCDIIICLLSSMFMWDPIYIMYHLDSLWIYNKQMKLWRYCDIAPSILLHSIITSRVHILLIDNSMSKSGYIFLHHHKSLCTRVYVSFALTHISRALAQEFWFKWS